MWRRVAKYFAAYFCSLFSICNANILDDLVILVLFWLTTLATTLLTTSFQSNVRPLCFPGVFYACYYCYHI